MIVRALIILCAMLAFCLTVQAEDVFLQAVRFALTGSDSSNDVTVINRKDCVFGIGHDVVHLNNVHVERISVQEWVQTANRQVRYVTVDLRGEGVVYEEFKAALARTPETEQIVSEMQKNALPSADLDLFKSRVAKSSEHRLTIYTDEKDRLVRAWKYIYENGCTGRKSPF